MNKAVRTVIAGVVAGLLVGMAALVAQMPTNQQEQEQPEFVWTTILTFNQINGYGGDTVFECDPGRLPWRAGSCASFPVAGTNCAYWSQTFETDYSGIRCDGRLHTFRTKTYWIKNGTGYYNIGSVTPQYTMPFGCFPLGPYRVDNSIVGSASPCPTVVPSPTPLTCASPYPIHCPPEWVTYGGYSYWTAGTCCPAGWDCQTTFSWGCECLISNCCHYDSNNNWVCLYQ